MYKAQTLTLALTPAMDIVTVVPNRLQKMALKGFVIRDEEILRFMDATVIDPAVDLAYDYPILSESHHPRVRDNILRKFGLLPIPVSETLVPLTPVPTYPMNRNTNWRDNRWRP